MFSETCSGVSQKQWILEFSNLCHCIQYPWTLTSSEVSGALGMKENHFLSKNVFWENGVGYLRNGECWSFQTFAIVFSTPKNLLVEVSGALGMKESHFLSKNMFWENAMGNLRNSECWRFQTFAIVFSTPKYLLVCQVSGASRNERKPLL